MADKELARDCLKRHSELEHRRWDYEPTWQAVAEFCAPDAPEMAWGRLGGGVGEGQAARADRRTRKVYDNTIISAVRRLGAGLESLITPQSEKWHGLSTGAMDDEETEEEKEWAESLRDFLFTIRYQAGSGFVPAIQSCYQNVIRFGPGYLYSEESFDARHIRYRSLPVSETYIARDRWGEVDTLHRRYEVTARQAVQMFEKKKLPAKVKEMADDPVKQFEKLIVVHCVQKRQEKGSKKDDGGYSRDVGPLMAKDMPFASYHILEGEEECVKEGGFWTFPVACFNWGRQDGDDYGSSPVVEALTMVREINAVRKSGLRALQQVTDPALAGPANLDYVPDLNPGSFHPGLMSDQGQMRVGPINSGLNPNFAFDYAARQAEAIQDALFVNLFQILIQNPQMTATEALIRQEEKGNLLGPAGSVIQGGLSMQVDRELSILEAKGLYEEGSRFMPPESLAGKQIRVDFTSPLDVLRRSAEARDTLQLVSTVVSLAQGEPAALDNIDFDEAIRVVQSAGRAPQKVLRRTDEVEAIRQAKAQAATAQAGMAAMQSAAGMAKDAVPALVQAREAGLMSGLVGAPQ